MIKKCTIENLARCVEIAYAQNSRPQSRCAYCPSAAEDIQKEFEAMIKAPGCMVAGYFADEKLVGVLGCFYNPDNGWVDFVGPFIDGGWNRDAAKGMVLFALSELVKAERFNFYFNAKNKNCHDLMKLLPARRGDNEYILQLNKEDYSPQKINARVVDYTDEYERDVVQLHDEMFPDIYVTGREIVDTIGKGRRVFCALDESGGFVGYGVLNDSDGSRHLIAEIFAVKAQQRGKGYGWALLNRVADTAFCDNGGDSVELVVDRLNTRARKLYDSCGFKLKVENEAYYILKSDI